MKPKDRVYCPQCHRSKMLFRTRKEADMFIEYNGDDIQDENGYKPIRAYYCSACCGWHITSKEKLAYDYESVQKLLSKFVGPDIIWPDDNDDTNNPCIVKARKKVYTYIKDIQIIEYKTPETIEDDMLGALASVKGYWNLAKYESDSYKQDAAACQSYLCTLLVQTIIVNLSKLSSIESFDDVKTEELGRTIITQTLKFTAVLHNFDDYVRLSLDYRNDVENESSRIHQLYLSYMRDTKKDRISRKLDEHINTIQSLMDRNDYLGASKFVHFAVLLIKKYSNDTMLHNMFLSYIDKLMELQSIIHDDSEPQIDIGVQ